VGGAIQEGYWGKKVRFQEVGNRPTGEGRKILVEGDRKIDRTVRRSSANRAGLGEVCGKVSRRRGRKGRKNGLETRSRGREGSLAWGEEKQLKNEGKEGKSKGDPASKSVTH